MRILVLGAGLQGTACAFDLLGSTNARVTLADQRPRGVPRLLQPFGAERLALLQLDARNEDAVRAVMREHDAVLSALPYYFNYPMTQLAVELGMHFADLGGNTEIVRQQKQLHEPARAQGIAVTPDVGLAPGLVNIVAAEAIRRVDRARSVKLYVGGLPRRPEPPLDYQVVYSLEGALDYYTTPSWVLRDGRPTQVNALSELETVEFPPPLGELEAFHTGGGISTMPWDFAGAVEVMEYKTLRYPGHAHVMRAIRDLGLLSLEPVDVKGVKVRPRDLFIATVDPMLRRPDAEDVVALQVRVEGEKQGEPATVTFRLLDCYDSRHGVSAMMRTTGYSLSIAGQLQLSGKMPPGVEPAHLTTPFEDYVRELGRRGIDVTEAGEA